MGTLSGLKNDKTKIVTLGVFLADIVILVIVLVILWVMPAPKTPGDNCGYMCLPCNTDPNGVCCGCRDVILSEFLKKRFDETYSQAYDDYNKIYESRIGKAKLYQGYIGDVKPVAHLIGEKREPNEKFEQPVRKWYIGNNCLLLNGMSMTEGRLRVPASGYYNVYSMLDISYRILQGDKIQTEDSVLVHSMYRYNIDEDENEEVLTTYHPYVLSKNGVFGRFDTYTSSDLYLKAGDEVYVRVSNISQVNSPPKNVIGIYMI